MTKLDEPRLDHEIELRMMGDWGHANLHRLCGWLAAEMGRRVPLGSRFSTWNGRGGTDAVDAVLEGRVDTAFFVPACFAADFLRPEGLGAGREVERLRAIATMPQTDRLVIAIERQLGLRSLADVRAARPALRIAAGPDDGVNMVGHATHRMLEAAGLARATLERWGGTFLEDEAPWDVLAHGLSGAANVVIFEAVMLPLWSELVRARDMIFIPLDDELLTQLEQAHSMPRAQVRADRFPGLDGPFETLDFSDFLLVCSDDFAEDIAHLMTWCACETTETIEAQYRHIPAQDSPLSYPLQPAKMVQTPLPLHPGAARYYREAGYL